MPNLSEAPSERVRELEELLKNERELSSNLKERIDALESELEALNSFSSVNETNAAYRNFLSRLSPMKIPEKKPTSLQKKQGVIAQRPTVASAASFKVNLVAKDEESKKLIRSAFSVNRLLCSLESSQIQDIIDTMEMKSFKPGESVIEERTEGEELFVSAGGVYEVLVDGNQVKTFGKGIVFGELAVLYGCQRTATVRALPTSAGERHSVWFIDRHSFQMITMRTSVLRHQERLKFVKSLKVFSHLREEHFIPLVDALTEERYAATEYVVRQGSIGETFYIVQDGTFSVTQRDKKGESFLRRLTVGDTFGEKALESDDVRTANVVADTNASVLCLDRETFLRLSGSAASIADLPNVYDSSECGPSSTSSEEESETVQYGLDDFDVLGRLGSGR